MSKQSESLEHSKTLKEKILISIVPILFSLIQRVYVLTLRVKVIGAEHLENLARNNKPWIYSVWHTNVIFTPIFTKKYPATVMISSSRDGELITRVVRQFGHDAVRGSSTRGGLKALKGFISGLKNGGRGGITPDGPLGPAFKMQEGLLIAASRSGAPVVPFYYEASPQWIVEKSWDKQRIPKPFSRVVISFGAPVYVPQGLDEKQYSELSERVQKALLDNVNRCRKELGYGPLDVEY